MNIESVAAWASPDGRVGRSGYWLWYILPSMVLIPATVFAGPLGLAALWIFAVGSLKRFRDLKMSTGRAATLAGTWVTAVIIATVSGAAMIFFGLLAMMGNGGPDGEPIMVAGALVFIVPFLAGPVLLGLMPGTPEVVGVPSPPGIAHPPE